jgi:hypothetical protein
MLLEENFEREFVKKILDLKIVSVLSEKQLGFLLYTSY